MIAVELAPDRLASDMAGEQPRGARAPGALGLVDELLRDRARVLARIDEGRELAAMARVLLATMVVASASFGVAVGSYRGGAQLAFAAIKVPMVLVGTAVVCAPTLTAIGRALGRPASLPRDLALLLAALAHGGLILLALSPLVLAARAADIGYHQAILMTTGCATLAAGGALVTLHRGVRRRGAAGTWTALIVLATVFAAVGAQATWTLRPFVVRPRTTDVPFVRELDGSLYDALRRSTRSAFGVYDPPEPDWHEVFTMFARGAGPAATVASATDASATDPSATDASVTDAGATDAGATDPSATAPTAASPPAQARAVEPATSPPPADEAPGQAQDAPAPGRDSGDVPP